MKWKSQPFTDLIGGYYMEFALSSKGQQWNGEFHTPKTVCDLMAKMTMGDIELLPADQLITVCEPACGSGVMHPVGGAGMIREQCAAGCGVTAISTSHRTAC